MVPALAHVDSATDKCKSDRKPSRKSQSLSKVSGARCSSSNEAGVRRIEERDSCNRGVHVQKELR